MLGGRVLKDYVNSKHVLPHNNVGFLFFETGKVRRLMTINPRGLNLDFHALLLTFVSVCKRQLFKTLMLWCIIIGFGLTSDWLIKWRKVF